MGRYQGYKGNPETKLFYILDQLIGGINTDFSDDTSPDNEFKSIVNFTMDKRGSLFKRMGFGKLNAVSEIFNKFDELPDTKTYSENSDTSANDNIVYMKMLVNDNNCFRNLSAFTGEKAYRKYQEIYGGQENSFKLLIITTNYLYNTSKAWIYSCKLPKLVYGEDGLPTEEETIEIKSDIIDLPVLFKWNKNLSNIDTIEFFDKIYFTNNNKGLVCFDRKTDKFTYTAKLSDDSENTAYKPSPMEVRKIGFNVLGDDPLHWVDYQGLSTDSIQGMYITSLDDKPLTVIPNGMKFRINILYTGEDKGFTITYKEGEKELQADTTLKEELCSEGLKVYEVSFKSAPTSEVEIKINKTEAEISDYYDYYQVGNVDPEIKVVERLDIGDYGICEMYNRAVYYKNDTVWFSEINNFSYVPNYNYISLPIEPTDKITKIIYFRNVYVIFTKQRIYKMIGSFGDSTFQVMPLNLSMGCHAPNTIVPVENVLYFASPRGLYQLTSISNYVTTNATFENVKEIDTKIKKLTSDVTLYIGEISDPSIRHSGISENAYGIRYKDKYMLFYNQNNEANSNDVLVYQYELKAFSEMKFPIKPTFLFMIDGIIETYCKIPEKEIYSEATTLLKYDFENTDNDSGVIKDLSGNSNDAKMVGGVILSPGTGLLTDGEGFYVKAGVIGSKYNLLNGFSILSKCQISGGIDLYSLKKSTPILRDKTQIITMETNKANGYKGVVTFETHPNPETMQNIVNWKLTWFRDSNSINGDGKGKINLENTSDEVKLIDNIEFSYNMETDELSKDVASGSFTVKHDSNGDYTKNWKLSLTSSYPTYSTGWEKGSPIPFNVTQKASWSSEFGIRIEGNAVARDNGCSVTYTPYFVVDSGSSISIGSRTISVNIGGNNRYHNVPSSSGAGYREFSGGQQVQEFYYDSNGETKFVDASFDIRADINGTFRQSVDIDGFNIDLPKSKSYSITNWNDFELTAATEITLNRINKPSYGDISLVVNSDNELKLICKSSTIDFEEVLTNDSISLFGNHDWKVDYLITGDQLTINVYIDGDLFGSCSTSKKCIENHDRDASILFKNNTGSINMFSINNSDKDILKYLFDDGKGTTISDRSGNNINGTIFGGHSWTNEKGIKFNGENGYLVLPKLSDSVMFTNGYTIEFEGKLFNRDKPVRIFDIATNYDSSSSNKCNIYVSLFNNKLIMSSTSSSNKNYKISLDNVRLEERHKWKFSVIDTGKDYDISVSCDDQVISTIKYNYGGISNIVRKSNFIGRSNDTNDELFNGVLYNFRVDINYSPNPSPIYVGAFYEYDTTYDDFGRPMEILLETKGINLQYPMHVKKLKNIFVKGLGGYKYNEFFFEVYSDGHIVNDPKVYDCYVDDITHQVVYTYSERKDLSFDEMLSVLGNIRLSDTEFGESAYETKKVIIPAKGKNFKIKLYGTSDDHLSIESFGFVFKLGKVREE